MDFSLDTYKELLTQLKLCNHPFLTHSEIYSTQLNKFICLRHDVDKAPINSLQFARLQSKMEIRASYFFRIIKKSFNTEIIKEIRDLGHEIGYHYESLAAKKGDFQSAIVDFKMNLDKIRELAPVKSICMHGSPLSSYDSRKLWKYYDYRDYDIIAEPYFDIDFSKVLYLTDTGRRWNGDKIAVRDKLTSANTFNEDNVLYPSISYAKWKVAIPPNSAMNMTPAASNFQSQFDFKNTSEIITAAQNKLLPDKIMLTFHPQRWTDHPIPWFKELLLQNTKNVVKYYFIKLGRK